MLKISYRDNILQCNFVYVIPIFYDREGDIISKLKMETLQDVFDCYGKDNLICLDLLKQIIFYTKLGIQPVFTCESEKESRKGQLVCWFLKSETQWVYQKRKENRPVCSE